MPKNSRAFLGITNWWFPTGWRNGRKYLARSASPSLWFGGSTLILVFGKSIRGFALAEDLNKLMVWGSSPRLHASPYWALLGPWIRWKPSYKQKSSWVLSYFICTDVFLSFMLDVSLPKYENKSTKKWCGESYDGFAEVYLLLVPGNG